MLSYSPVAAKAAVATPSSMAPASADLRMDLVMVVSLGIVVVGSSPGFWLLARGRLALPKPECLDLYHRYASIVGQAVTHSRYLTGGKRGEIR
jgi:hypothetical protein